MVLAKAQLDGHYSVRRSTSCHQATRPQASFASRWPSESGSSASPSRPARVVFLDLIAPALCGVGDRLGLDQAGLESKAELVGGGYGGRVFVADLRHYLDLPEDAPAALRRQAAHLVSIVRAASARGVGAGATSAVGCIRRPGRRPCDGYVMVFRRSSGEIAWACDTCGDEGVISGWQGSPADVSSLDDSYAEGDFVVLEVSRPAAAVLWSVLLLDAASELIVARAEGRPAGVLLAGRMGGFEELVESVAAEANAETDGRRRRQLDLVCECLEAAIAGDE